MSFNKKTWVNRQSEYPTRRKLISTGVENEYDVARSEGAVSQEGDAFSAETMNDLESRIEEAFEHTAYKVIKNVTIATSLCVDNTDSYKTYYPYCFDYAIADMTATCKAEVSFSPATIALGVIAAQGQTMDGKLRVYLDAKPEENLVIDSIIYQEVSG